MPNTTRQVPSKDEFAKNLALYRKYTTTVLEKLAAFKKRDETDECLSTIQTRMLRGLDSIQALDAQTTHDRLADATAILRAIYDLHLQCLYILKDPTQFASDFVDYAWVERFELSQIMVQRPQYIAWWQQIPEFHTKLMPDLQNQYNAVRHRFLAKNGKNCRRHWYKGTLADLAQKVGYPDEYEVMQRILSAAVHSNPTVLTAFPGVSPEIVVHDAWIFTLRVVGRIATYMGIPLDGYEKVVMDLAMERLW